jgi:serine/threonine protein kinase/Flp pilus assembly protein TadD
MWWVAIMADQPQSVEELFASALECSPKERGKFLDRACANAPEVRRRVEELLLAHEEAKSSSQGPLISREDQLQPEMEIGAKPHAETIPGAAAASVGRFAPGQVIAGRFAVVRFIAHGGMGEVYEVEDEFLKSVHVALKVVRQHIAESEGSAHRFEQEVLLARKVTHPNLCPIYDISRCQDPPPPFLFLTMKFLTGETLASRLQRSPRLSRDEVISIIRQMVAGIGALHSGGIIHRDIKPNNVMLEGSGPELSLSIMDFGLARLYESQTTVLTRSLIAGTPGYLAPELLQGEPPSQATDIFALGVLLQQTMTGEYPATEEHRLSAKPSTALDAADVPAVYIEAVKEFLSQDPERRCAAFKQVRMAFDSGSTNAVESFLHSSRRKMTRRQFAVGSALAACGAAGVIVWKRDRLDDLMHPLPRKRFVALLGWPPLPDARLKPMLSGVIDAIGNELSRAEAFDHDLFVITEKNVTEVKTPAQLNELRESLGANLVLGASSVPVGEGIRLLLTVLDDTAKRPLRKKQIQVSADQQTTLPEKAVRAAAQLLDVSHYKADPKRTKAGTSNTEAYAAFQAAETLRKQENATGLDAAIAKYKQAIEIDPHYAVAQAKLSWAYLMSYYMHHDPAALSLAHENAETAVSLDPNLVDAHVVLAWVDHLLGNKENAGREMLKALALDPSNPNTLVYQAQFYAQNEHWKDAENTFSRILKLRPNYWLAHNELGVVMYAEGKYSDALMEFRKASLAAPNNALASANIGAIYLQLGRVSDAAAPLEKSYQLNANEQAAINMAAMNRLQRKYAEAIRWGREAVKLEPTDAGNWLELGDSYAAAGQKKDAAGAYRRASELQEEQLRTEAKNGPAWMLLALCNAKADKIESSGDLMEKAERLGADDMDSQLMKVRILALLHRNQEGIAVMTRCLARGATAFQFQTMPDLELLRTDPRFKSVIASSSSVRNDTM